MSPDPTTAEADAQTRAIAAVIALVAARFKLTPSELLGPGRAEPLVTIRQIAMKIARDVTGASFPDLAAAFGKGDHETVRHACEVAERKARERKLHATMTNLRASARAETAQIRKPRAA